MCVAFLYELTPAGGVSHVTLVHLFWSPLLLYPATAPALFIAY